VEVEVDAVALEPRAVPPLAAYDRARPVDQDGRIGLRRQALGREARDFCAVIRAYRIAVDRRRPETGKRGRVVAIDDDFSQSAHRTNLPAVLPGLDRGPAKHPTKGRRCRVAGSSLTMTPRGI